MCSLFAMFLDGLFLVYFFPLDLHLLSVDDLIAHFRVQGLLKAALRSAVIGEGLVGVRLVGVHRLK